MTKAQAKKIFKREVYRNLHFRDETVYSVRKDGLVQGHALTVLLDGTTDSPIVFAVGPKGNQRVRDEQRKNVHAVIRGYIVNAVWYPQGSVPLGTIEREQCLSACDYFKSEHMAEYEGYEWKEVTYNPYKYKTFITVDDGEPIFTARRVVIGEEVWAMVPTQEKQEEN